MTLQIKYSISKEGASRARQLQREKFGQISGGSAGGMKTFRGKCGTKERKLLLYFVPRVCLELY